MLRLVHNNKTTQAPREINYLYRRNSERVIAGVCAGIAKYFDADALVIRLLALLICGATWGLGGLAYLVLWRKMPLITSDSGVYDISIPESKHVLQLHIPFHEIAFAWLFLLSLGILSGISFSIHHALPLYSFLPALLFVFAL
ncbi:MAG: PspC domain-containing protein, partial [Eggerthellaceae bacterium]|nr:PspC domain-containing protein [Eggerthellaceae bacterium]